MNGLKVLFIFFLISLSFGEIGRLQLVNYIAVHLNDILLFFVLGMWIIFSKTKIKQIIGIQLFKPLVLFSSIALLSLFISIHKYTQLEILTSFLYLVRWVGYAILYFIVLDFDEIFKKKIKYFMVVVGGIIVGLGYVQYFLYPDLRNLYYAGWDEHLYRMFSTFLDPNFAGAFFVMYFMLLLGLFHKEVVIARSEATRQSSKRFPRSVFTSLGMTIRSLYGFLSLITLGAILLTYSRSAYLMLVVSLFIFLLLQRQKKLLFGLLGLALVAPILFFFSPKSEGTNLLRTASSFARVAAFQNAFTLFKENPIFGVGFNAYRYAQGEHGFLLPTEKENHAGAGTDNSFLFVLATTGVIGFGAYVYLWYVIINKLLSYRHSGEERERRLQNRSWTSQDDIQIIVLSTLAGLLVNAMFINSLFYPSIMVFLWIELGLITDYKQQ